MVVQFTRTLVFALEALIRDVTFVKMAPLVHVEKLDHLFAFIAP